MAIIGSIRIGESEQCIEVLKRTCTYQKHPELKIPNTTNSLDGYFNILKGLLTVHREMKTKRRYRLIQEILAKQHYISLVNPFFFELSAPRPGFEPGTFSLHVIQCFRKGADYIIIPGGCFGI